MSVTTRVNNVITEVRSFTYDSNGNQLQVTRTPYSEGTAGTPVVESINEYNVLNQLIRTTVGDTVVENAYNGEGYRVSKTVNGQETRYLYEYDKVVLEVDASGNQIARNIYGINLLTRTVDGQTLYYMYNGHADVTALITANNTIVATYYYDAFGNILEQTGDVNNPIRYAGYQWDEETGLYYLNARMYDPVTARFLQEDSYRGNRLDPLSLNLYTYCSNEPIMYWDPSGHIKVWMPSLDDAKGFLGRATNFGHRVLDRVTNFGQRILDGNKNTEIREDLDRYIRRDTEEGKKARKEISEAQRTSSLINSLVGRIFISPQERARMQNDIEVQARLAREDYAKNDAFYNMVKFEPELIVESKYFDFVADRIFQEDLSISTRKSMLSRYPKTTLNLMYDASRLSNSELNIRNAGIAIRAANSGRLLRFNMWIDFQAAISELGSPNPSKENFEIRRDALRMVYTYQASKIISNGLTSTYRYSQAKRSSKLLWGSWDDYEKVVVKINGKEHTYAKVGDRLYSKHAIDRMQPSGNRYGHRITQAGGDYGRGVAPQYVEDVINSVKPIVQENSNLKYVGGSLEVITNPQGAVVTVMTTK